MNNNNDMKMAELLCSKLCHDLISPIGAINNGFEFLQDESSGMLNEATELIGRSAKQAGDRLTYFRLALGTGVVTDLLAMAEVAELIDNLAREKKLEIEWTGTVSDNQAKIGKISGKLLLNLMLIAFDCLPRGGRVEISLENNAENPDITINLSGDKCNLREDIKTGFDSQLSLELLTVRNVLAFYCVNLAKYCNKTLKLNEEFPRLIMFKVS